MENVEIKKFVRCDSFGNQMFVDVSILNGEKNSVKISLKLNGHERYRNIGVVTFDDNTLHVTRVKEKHFHHKAGGYGFNNELLSEKIMFKIERIHIVEDGNTEYNFPKSVIDEHGTFLHFKAQGFELQRFLNFQFIKPFEQ